MEAKSVEQLNQSLSAGSKRRLHAYVSQLASDRTKVIYDDRVIKELLKYAYKPDEVKSTLAYLRRLKDDHGRSFSQSLKEASKLIESVEKFAMKNHPRFRWNRFYKMAKKWLMEQFSYLNLRPLTYCSEEDIREALPKVSTNAGWTYILTGKRTKGENLEGVFSEYSQFEEAAKSKGTFDRPILPAARTQGGGAFEERTGKETGTCKHKTRLVAMIDLLVIIAELRFAKPFQKVFCSWGGYAGGKDNEKIRSNVLDGRAKYEYWTSLDSSAFDQSISDWLIEDAFEIIRSAFKDEGFDEQLWKVVVHDFIHKSYISPDGRIIHSSRGVPSGSMFTQIVDSIVNLLMIATYLQAIGQRKWRMIVMGDDNLVFTDVPLDMDNVATYITKNFGVKINGDKSSHGSRFVDPEFLSRFWRYSGEWRHPKILISKLAYPERFRNYDKEKVPPYLVLYSYIDSYKSAMSELMDVNRFFDDHPNLNASDLEKVGSNFRNGFEVYTRENETKAS